MRYGLNDRGVLTYLSTGSAGWCSLFAADCTGRPQYHSESCAEAQTPCANYPHTYWRTNMLKFLDVLFAGILLWLICNFLVSLVRGRQQAFSHAHPVRRQDNGLQQAFSDAHPVYRQDNEPLQAPNDSSHPTDAYMFTPQTTSNTRGSRSSRNLTADERLALGRKVMDGATFLGLLGTQCAAAIASGKVLYAADGETVVLSRELLESGKADCPFCHKFHGNAHGLPHGQPDTYPTTLAATFANSFGRTAYLLTKDGQHLFVSATCLQQYCYPYRDKLADSESKQRFKECSPPEKGT